MTERADKRLTLTWRQNRNYSD